MARRPRCAAARAAQAALTAGLPASNVNSQSEFVFDNSTMSPRRPLIIAGRELADALDLLDRLPGELAVTLKGIH
jgi:hypothetical protein